MSENENQNENEQKTVENNPMTTEVTEKKGKSKLLIIILAVVLLGGAGGGFYYWRASSAAAEEGSAEEKSEKSKGKKDSKKAEEEEEPEKESAKSSGKSSIKNAIPDDEDVKHIIELPPFIVNLADSEQARYLRMSVSLGVGGEGEESEKPDPLFMTRVRNAMLAVLSNKSSEEVLTVEGKNKLRKELLQAAKAASEEPEIKAIYITDFIVQL